MKRVYLDQCAVSHLCNDAAIPWDKTPTGKVIRRRMTDKKLETWISPAHALETLLCADFDPDNRPTHTAKVEKRQRIARTLLDVSEAKRMLPSYEFILVEEFMAFLANIAPDCVRTRAVYRHFREHNKQMFLGIVALLAAYRDLDRPEAVETTLREKISTRLQHSRFAKDPDSFIDGMIETAKEFRLAPQDAWKDMDEKPLAELLTEIEANLHGAKPLSKTAKTRLQKSKGEVAAAYGAAEIGHALDVVFEDRLLTAMTFDIGEIKKHWGTFEALIGNPVSMPGELFRATTDEHFWDPEVVELSLRTLFRHAARHVLLSPRIVNHVVIGEVEMALYDGEIPSAGVGFDSAHAAILHHVDVFMTTDNHLANLARRAAELIQKETRKKLQVTIVTTADQLAAAVDG